MTKVKTEYVSFVGEIKGRELSIEEAEDLIENNKIIKSTTLSGCGFVTEIFILEDDNVIIIEETKCESPFENDWIEFFCFVGECDFIPAAPVKFI